MMAMSDCEPITMPTSGESLTLGTSLTVRACFCRACAGPLLRERVVDDLGLGDRLGGCGVGRLAPFSLAEEQLALVRLERLARLVAHVVHADEELPHHCHHEIAPLGREREDLVVIPIERSHRAHVGDLHAKAPLDRPAEAGEELLLVAPADEQ